MAIQENSLYFVVNDRLRDPDRKNLKNFLPYMKLLLTGLYKLPVYDCNEQRLWRALNLPSISNYHKGKIIRWWAFSSCTVDMEQLGNFANAMPVIFNITTTRACKISQFSLFSKEEEVLIIPPIQFIVSNLTTLNGVTIIEIKEDPSFPICYLPKLAVSTGAKNNKDVEKKEKEKEEENNKKKEIEKKI